MWSKATSGDFAYSETIKAHVSAGSDTESQTSPSSRSSAPSIAIWTLSWSPRRRAQMQPARRRRVETGVPAAGDRIYGTGYGIGTLNNHTGRSRGRSGAVANP